MNSLRDAIKSRRSAIVIKLDPETMEAEVVPEMKTEAPQLPEQDGPDLDEFSESESPHQEMHEESGHAESGELTLSPEEIKRVKKLIASGKEPASIQERMLLEQYKLQGE